VVVNYLDTQIALVEAQEGIAIIPSFGLPACRNRRVVMSQLINPVVNLEFYQITNRGNGRAAPVFCKSSDREIDYCQTCNFSALAEGSFTPSIMAIVGATCRISTTPRSRPDAIPRPMMKSEARISGRSGRYP
jgi:hypothetical protein